MATKPKPFLRGVSNVSKVWRTSLVPQLDRPLFSAAGTFEDFDAVQAAMDGAWVNTNSFTVGEKRELFAGIRIFEVAKQSPSMLHYVQPQLCNKGEVCWFWFYNAFTH